VQITLLGSGGWIPTAERETCCALLRSERHGLLIDAGTGLRRLVERPALLAGLERLDIVLTHFHLDHVAGLSYLPALGLRPAVWGGGRRIADHSTAELLERLLGRPLFPVPPETLFEAVDDIPEGPLELGPFTIETRVQRRHADPTLALRIGGLVYCTDTGSDPEAAAFTAGAEVLFHDAWTPEAGDDNHASAAEAAAIAAAAGAERLVLIHVNPLTPAADLLSAARAVFPATTLGADLQEHEARSPGRR
jgi:ribonuclease BN (tRNA processing enzyme)